MVEEEIFKAGQAGKDIKQQYERQRQQQQQKYKTHT